MIRKECEQKQGRGKTVNLSGVARYGNNEAAKDPGISGPNRTHNTRIFDTIHNKMLNPDPCIYLL